MTSVLHDTVIEKVVRHEFCCCCGLCAVVCPRQRLAIQETEFGEFFPVVDVNAIATEKNCGDSCRLCLNVCPFASDTKNNKLALAEQFGSDVGSFGYDDALGFYHQAFVGAVSQESERLKAPSGGFATALLSRLLEEKRIDAAIVASPTAERPWFKRRIATTADEILHSRGSVYHVLKNDDVLREVLNGPEQRYAIREHLHHPLSVSEAFYAKTLEPYLWSQELLDFYEETDSFIYGIVVWNRTQMKCAMRRWMLGFLHRHQMPQGRILLCGDGIGIDSFFFAQAGYNVVFYEISRYGQQIARRLFDDYHVNVQLVDTLESSSPESFDAIISLDVLEHVPSPPEMVQDLSKRLRPGGFLIVSAPFYAVYPQWPTHLKCNRKYSGRTRWLAQAGQMKLIDGCAFANPLAFQKYCDDKQDMFSLPFGKRLSLGFGGLFLRFSATFPALILNTALSLHRRDAQLKLLMPENDL